jgi:hypothetical protein
MDVNEHSDYPTLHLDTNSSKGKMPLLLFCISQL